MTTLREFGSRLRGLFGKQQRESDLSDEVASHLELLAQENIRRGLSPRDAQTAARRDFGAIEQIKETYRERRGLPMLETFGQDLRFGARMLRKNPGFTAVAILTLALGIGANTAIFSVVNALLLTPLRFKDPDRLVMVWENLRTGNNPENNISPANFLQWQEHNTVFEQMAAMYDDHLNLTGEGEPEQISYKGVSPNFFTLLGGALHWTKFFGRQRYSWQR
jgi:putative ABC transport system permease protein